MQELTNCLRKLRLEKDLTQKELAKLTKISRQTINSIERGRTIRPSDEVMLTLSNFFNKNVSDIFFTPLVKHVYQKTNHEKQVKGTNSDATH